MIRTATSPGWLCFNPTCPQPANPEGAESCLSCGAALSLQGRYWAVRSLGQGGLGRTLLAIDRSQQPPGLCVVQQRWLNSVDFTLNRDWLNQVGQHPQTPTFLTSFNQGTCSYLVQEYIQGTDLATWLQERGPCSPAEIWVILKSMLPVLRFIHAAGGIHRDIKPENLIVRGGDLGSGELVLVDFGSLQRGSDWQRETAIGSPEYAAPEQLAGRAVFASDLYSLGVTCLHLLTGMRPFELWDPVNHGWIWQNYWSSAQASQHLDLVLLLNQLVEPSLGKRFISAERAIATLHQSRRPPPAPASPPKSSWICYATLTGHQGLFAGVKAVAISADSQIVASASEDQTIRLWNLETGAEIGVLQGHAKAVHALAAHPEDATLLVSGGRDRQIYLWTMAEGKHLRTLSGHEKAVNALAFNRQGHWLASGSADKTIKLWELATDRLIATLRGHALGVTAIAFSPTQPLLVSASSDSTVRVWDLERFELHQTLRLHTAAVRTVAFSPNGQCLASAGEDRAIHLWDPASWTLQRTLSGHPWSVSSLSFHPDHRMLWSGSWDKTVKAWDVGSGREVAALVGHTDSIDCLAIAPSHQAIATGSQDKTIKLWRPLSNGI